MDVSACVRCVCERVQAHGSCWGLAVVSMGIVVSAYKSGCVWGLFRAQVCYWVS